VVLINCIALETNDFLLHLEADPLLVDIFQLLEGYLLEILVQLLNLLLLVLSKLLLNRVDAGQHLSCCRINMLRFPLAL
jgi:hypothetical protein